MSQSFQTLSVWQKVTALCLGLVFFLGSGELLAYGLITNDWVLNTTSELSSTRWYLQWLKKNRFTPQKTITNYSAIDVYDTQLGWSPKKSSQAVMYDGTIVTFNTSGARGLKEYSIEKPLGKQRILVIGDSFTFGEQVNDAETFSAVLESKLPNIEVMNFGVHGYGIDQMLLNFERQAALYKPDVVVFAFIFDDFMRGFLSFRDYQKPLFELSNGALNLTQVSIPEPLALARRSRFQLNTPLAVQLLKERMWFYFNKTPQLDLFAEAIFTRVNTFARTNNIIPVFVSLPSGDELKTIDTPEPTAGDELLVRFCQKTEAVCLSARPYLLAAYKAGARYDSTRHYSAATHQIVADGLFVDLTRYQVLNYAAQANPNF